MKKILYYRNSRLTAQLNDRRSYRSHLESLEKIMNKSCSDYIPRANQLVSLRSSMNHSFLFNQSVRRQEIVHSNSLLYQKILQSSPSPKILPLPNPEIKEPEINKSGGIVLKNHRQSPVFKLTLFQRNRENLRLAMRLSHPLKNIDHKKLAETHRANSSIKTRIQKYESSQLKTARFADKLVIRSSKGDPKGDSNSTPTERYLNAVLDQ